jgi:hypothetical protein
MSTHSSCQQWQIAVAQADTRSTGAAALGFALTPKLRLGFSLICAYGLDAELGARENRRRQQLLTAAVHAGACC